MKIFTGFMLVILLSGCAAYSAKDSARQLKTAQESIVLAARTADNLCTEGVLSQEQCNKAASLYKRSQKIYTNALEFELLYLSNQGKFKDERERARKNLFDTLTKIGEIAYGY